MPLMKPTARPAGHALVLIPWHLGNLADVTLNTVGTVKRLRRFLAEDAEGARSQIEQVLRQDCSGKEFLTLPDHLDRGFLRRVLRMLESEDVGMVASGGVPCFGDPGAWVVRALRERGVPITPMAGASSLSALLSVSGFDWIYSPRSRAFSFVFFEETGGHDGFCKVVGRGREPVIVFLAKGAFAPCLKIMRPVVRGRLVSAFFDLTKLPKSSFPYADRVLTMGCSQWLAEAGRLPWDKVSDVALIVHPRGA